jgi:hypothetical protein
MLRVSPPRWKIRLFTFGEHSNKKLRNPTHKPTVAYTNKQSSSNSNISPGCQRIVAIHEAVGSSNDVSGTDEKAFCLGGVQLQQKAKVHDRGYVRNKKNSPVSLSRSRNLSE